MDKTEALNSFSLLTMILRFYSFLVLLWDFNIFLLYTLFSILNAIFELISPKPLKPVDSEKVLIVGSSRGVGKELALQLSQLGACIVCWDINTSGNEELVKQIRLKNGQAYAYTCDVTDQDKVLEMAKKVQKEIGDITMMFNCSGVPSPRSLLAQKPPDIKDTISLGVLAHFYLLEAFLPRMKELDHGHIVTLTSVAGLTGINNQVPLSVTQFAVQGLVESLLEQTRTDKNLKNLHFTLCHIYPFIFSNDVANDIRLRISSFFGKIKSADAAHKIIDGVRRNYVEISIPGYLLYLGHALKLLPRNSTCMLKDMLNTGTDFA